MKDFSLNMLKQLIAAFKKHNYYISRLDTYWSQQKEIDKKEKVVLLRHDIDRFPKTALLIAKMEAEMSIFGTYFFRTKSHVFKPEIIKEIIKMGHEIGYHYECLADAKGNLKKTVQLCKNDLEKLRKLYPVVSAAMHSRPLSKWDNRLIWKKYPLGKFNLKGEAYLSVDHSKYLYLSDSGRNWNTNENVVWDTIEGEKINDINKTSDLIEKINKGEIKKIHLLIHPNRWPKSNIGWIFQWTIDKGINLIKKLIKLYRKNLAKIT
jgi:hypothetical protein